MGRKKRRGRPIDGMLVLDKPQGMTSNAALQQVKHLFYAAKAGHTGSLDPLATGVLPICFGEATKFSQYLLDSDKTYLSTFCLGRTTSTGDSDGDRIADTDASALTEADFLSVWQRFQGEIEQVPSMYSAIKVDGQPLYKLAREGKEVEREARRVTIYEAELLDFRPGELAEVDVRLKVSKGTYIRTIAEDIGRELGVGAHVVALRRTQAGAYDIDQAITMEELLALKEQEAFAQMDELLLPVASAVDHLSSVSLAESTGFYLRQGQPVLVADSPREGLVKLAMDSGDFVGVGEVLDDGRVAPRRLVASV